ncbi:hypothetical protein M378DRAFT_641026 [Amanita muscaria Koide BX008]|uniref:Uncharacterized protein n=1 Tax=Amanita muscaria (strain Koide BX008) TaxID=946122 RepID=A0A0C2X5H5_AMAMK|nr:hypothetical protein M378DRAFT_641026 [Amanita muscaria Koide BX008]
MCIITTITNPALLLKGDLAQVSSVELASRRSERLVKELEDEVKQLSQLLQERTEELARVEDTADWQKAEVGKLNRLLQEKAAELASLEGTTHWQKGRHEKKIRILEAQVSGMTMDMNQQKEKYEEEIRDLQEKVGNLVEDMDQLEAKYEEEIRGLQAEVCNLVGLKAKYEEEIRGLKAKVLGMDLLASQQGREHNEEIERFESTVSRREDIGNQQMQKYKEEIECFKARISTLEAWLFSMEHVAVTEHEQEIEGLEEKYEKEIQRLEGIVADTGKQTSKPEKEIERSQANASSMEQVAKRPKAMQAKDPTKRVIQLGWPQQAQATNHSSTAANQMSDRLDQESRIKKGQKMSLFNVFNTSASGKQTNPLCKLSFPEQTVCP